MLAKLVEHERTHRNHGVVAAQQVQAALQAIGTQRDCARVEVLVRQALRREANRAGGLSRAFDRDTNCGAKQGVGLVDGSGELRLSDKTNALASPR